MLSFEGYSYSNEFLYDMLNMDEIMGVTSGGVYQPTVDVMGELGTQQEELDPEYVKRQNGVPWFYMSEMLTLGTECILSGCVSFQPKRRQTTGRVGFGRR